MTDRRTGMPIETDDAREEAAGGAAGNRGERAQDRSTDDPDLRREVDTVDGPVEVEDSSGSQHVEAERMATRPPPRERPHPRQRSPRRSSDAPAPRPATKQAEHSTGAKTWRIGIVGAAAALATGVVAYVAQRLWKRRG